MLATLNGRPHLAEQLESIASQTHPQIDIHASDDGSVDGTLDVLKTVADGWQKGAFRIVRRKEPAAGYDSNANSRSAAGIAEGLEGSNGNFLSLIDDRSIEADYYAFSDQDDVWEPTKLAKAIAWLDAQPVQSPALHCSRTMIINEAGTTLRPSLLFARPPSFQNAIIQNIAAGNTIVMNRAAMEAIRRHTRWGDFVSHDWWCYQVVTALGGRVRYDDEPLTRYRQHDANLIGENASWRARMVRFRLVIGGRFREWNDTNLRGLSGMRGSMPVEQRETLEVFEALREASPFRRLALLVRSGIHRQTTAGQFALYVAALLGKI